MAAERVAQNSVTDECMQVAKCVTSSVHAVHLHAWSAFERRSMPRRPSQVDASSTLKRCRDLITRALFCNNAAGHALPKKNYQGKHS